VKRREELRSITWQSKFWQKKDIKHPTFFWKFDHLVHGDLFATDLLKTSFNEPFGRNQPSSLPELNFTMQINA
jgi:hypothetical protein